MLRNIIFLVCSIILFFIGMVVYGIILNIREVSLQEAQKALNIEKLKEVSIVIERNRYKLHLYSDSILVKSYNCVFGRNNQLNKLKNDYATPIGNYKIVEIKDTTKFYKYFKLNYPNKKDAAEALKNNEISKMEYGTMISSINKGYYGVDNDIIDYDIGIHGIGEYDFIFRNLPFAFNWTNGSVAISNSGMDELNTCISVGTKVIIEN